MTASCRCPRMKRQRKSGMHRLQKAFARALVAGLFVTCCVAGQAQQIRIRALNAKNGKPIVNECLNVWYGKGKGAHLIAKTDKQGVAVLHLTQTGLSTESGCPGWPTQVSQQADSSVIVVAGDRYVACNKKYSKIKPGESQADPFDTMPNYPLATLLTSGISADNACGNFRAQAAPGELVLFMRAPEWWERMKQ
jgi:hypothetical protein